MKNIILATALAAIASPSSAGVVLNAVETGGNVVISGGGTLDISLANYWSTSPNQNSGVTPNQWIQFGPVATQDLYQFTSGFSGPPGIGPGGTTTFSTSSSGDHFGLNFLNALVFVPGGYSSGDPLTQSGTFAGHTFASIGLAEGSYTWTWDTASGGTDFFTINVPAPGVMAMAGFAALAAARRRRA